MIGHNHEVMMRNTDIGPASKAAAVTKVAALARAHPPDRRPLRPLTAILFLLSAMLVAIASGGARAEPRQYEIDPNHLSIGFLVEHIGYQRVLGMFREASGSFVFDEENRSLSDLRVVIKTASVFSNHEKRDEHLRGPDFLNSTEFPEMVFDMTDAEPLGQRSGKVVGNLTLLGVTRPVELDVTWNKTAEYPFGGGLFSDNPYVTGISARGSFKRSDFGMTYGIDNGLVGDEVEMIIELEAIRQ